ncbi:MAG: hypothetical protein ABIN57_03635 [Chitinophagaceae bacterium]
MKEAGKYSQACMEAWLSCENLLITLNKQEISFSERTKQVLDECAHICLGTVHAIANQITNLNQVALLCVGICEECAEVCERYNDFLFSECAHACRNCSSTITALASEAV